VDTENSQERGVGYSTPSSKHHYENYSCLKKKKKKKLSLDMATVLERFSVKYEFPSVMGNTNVIKITHMYCSLYDCDTHACIGVFVPADQVPRRA
jgi:hypothetical protein